MAATDPPAYTWSPPVYDISSQPELGQTYAIQDDGNNNQIFARNVRWTPDGSAFMAHCEDHTLQLFTPTNTYCVPVPPSNHGHNTNTNVMPNTDTENLSRRPTLVLRQPAPILDFTWFPGAAPSTDPTSFCFLTSVRESPVKLIDACDGRLRASYKIIDHRERFIAPHCMSFNLDASKIYCGHDSAIEIFDMSRPGDGTRILTTPSRKSKDGLKGIVSALSFSPDYASTSDAFYAAGTLNTTLSNLALFTESQPDVPIMFVGGGERAGVTQLRFNPMHPHILYAAYRRRQAILAWDLRSDVNTPFAKYAVPIKPSTNQKMGFDVDITGRRLAIGDQKGSIHVFDLSLPLSDDTTGTATLNLEPEMSIKNPDLSMVDAHSDSVGGVAFHPYQPMLLSVSGSRHFKDPPGVDSDFDVESESGDFDSDGENESIVHEVNSAALKPRSRPVTMDSSIKAWYFGNDAPSVVQPT